MVGARGPRSAIVLDVERDGDLDIVTNEFNAGPAFSSATWLLGTRGTTSGCDSEAIDPTATVSARG